MKRFLSLVLFAAMLLCAVPFSAAAAEEPTVVTIGSVRTLSDAWLQHPVILEICEKLNITLDFTQYDDDAFSLMLAGGGLADIVVGSSDYVSTIMTNKIAMNLYPLLDEYAPNIKNGQYLNTISVMQGMLDLNADELYMLAPNTGIENAGGSVQPARGYVVRWDYYKELGCPEINNDDDYIAVVRAMQANHPETADGKKTYGIGVERSVGDMGGYRASFVAENYTNPWVFGSYKFKSDFLTSELYDGYTDVEHSSYWTDMEFYNALYREGLFDVDSFTMTYDEWLAKVGNGTYMGLYLCDDELYRQMSQKDSETIQGYMVIPSKGAISFANKLSLLGNFPSGYTFIPAEAENWQKALAFLNEMFDENVIRELYCGKQGEYWDYDENGQPHLFDATFEKQAAGEMNWGLSGLNMLMPYSATTLHTDGAYINLFEQEEYRSRGLNALQKDFCEYYGMDYPGQLQQQMADAGDTIDLSNDRGQTISACISNIPMDIKRILDACNDILDRAMPRLVMAESDEEFNAIQQEVMQQLEEAEEKSAWEWALEQWNIAKEKVDPAWLAAKEG